MPSRLTHAARIGFLLGWMVGTASAQHLDDEHAEPTEQIAGGITYVTGGIGVDERASLMARTRSYNLMLMFRSRNSTEVLTDVAIRISTQKGNVLLRTISDGPIFLARMPKGRYVIQAVYHDHPLTREFVIGTAGKTHDRRFIFRWNASGG